MKQYKEVIVKEVLGITCDKCASEFQVNTPEFNEFVSIQKDCGYVSIFGDGSIVTADFCQTCFNELVGSFITVTEDNNDDDPLSMAAIKNSPEHEYIGENLIFDNIFDAVTDDKVEAEALKKHADGLIMLRSITQLMDRNFSYFKTIQSEEEHHAALTMMEHLIEDYDANLMLIDSLSCSIKRYEDSIY